LAIRRRRISARSAPGGEAAAKRAERSDFSPLYLSREWQKSRSAFLKLALIFNDSVAEPC
jgi:hypothetical protein